MNKVIVKGNDYVKGSTAIKPQRKVSVPKRDRKYEELEKAKNRRNKRLKVLKREKRNAVLQIALVVFVLGVITVWRDTKVYSIQSKLGEVKDQIHVVNSENEALRVELLKNSSLKNIEENAKNKLKMVDLSDADKVEIDLSKNYLEGLNSTGEDK